MARTRASCQAQLAACSGKKARWRNGVNWPWNLASPQARSNFSSGLPLKRQRPASSSSDGIEDGVGVVPDLGVQARGPEALRLGAHDGVAAVALQLLAMAAVQQGVVGPAGGAHDERGGGDGRIHAPPIRAQGKARPVRASRRSAEGWRRGACAGSCPSETARRRTGEAPRPPPGSGAANRRRAQQGQGSLAMSGPPLGLGAGDRDAGPAEEHQHPVDGRDRRAQAERGADRLQQQPDEQRAVQMGGHHRQGQGQDQRRGAARRADGRAARMDGQGLEVALDPARPLRRPDLQGGGRGLEGRAGQTSSRRPCAARRKPMSASSVTL
jgi:hypothetical protein